MRRVVAAVALATCAACTARAPTAVLPDDGATRQVSVDALLGANPLRSDDNIKATLLARTDSASYHLVQVRDRETPHLHAAHDLTVTVVRGTGTLRVAGTARPMSPGDVAVIPRGMPHQFVNTGREPAVAFVTFSPPADGPDQVPTSQP